MPPYIYIHIDPGARTLLYVGLGGYRDRYMEFTNRGQLHKARLLGLLKQGFTKAQIAHIVAESLRWQAADNLEKALIEHFWPPFNIVGRPEWRENMRKPSGQRRNGVQFLSQLSPGL